MGHQAEYIIKEEELTDLDFGDSANKSKGSSSSEKNSVVKSKQIDEDKLRSIIQEELDKRIGPLNKKITLLQQEETHSITDVLGGIGYIFGLMGIIFYFKAKGA
jgi:nickel transport protein